MLPGNAEGPGTPAGPEGPLGPVEPVGPCGPVGPEGPVLPAGRGLMSAKPPSLVRMGTYLLGLLVLLRQSRPGFR